MIGSTASFPTVRRLHITVCHADVHISTVGPPADHDAIIDSTLTRRATGMLYMDTRYICMSLTPL